jgi:hypothetical protein
MFFAIKQKMKVRIAAILISVITIFASPMLNNKASAFWGVLDIGTDPPNAIINAFNSVGTWASEAINLLDWSNTLSEKILLPIYKSAAITLVQKTVSAIIGGDSGSTSLVITDYSDYLFTKPQQRALLSMASFYTDTLGSGGEGVLNNYKNLLKGQAKSMVNGNSSCTMNIQNYVTDTGNLFKEGNMKGYLSYFSTCNNPYSYSLVAKDKYESEYNKEQTVAEKEEKNGYLPKKVNGLISSPASIAENALNNVDQLGNQMIVNATKPSELLVGSVLSIGSRTLQYGIGDSSTKSRIKSNNSSVSYSISYSQSSGVGVTTTSSDGTTVSGTSN